LGGGGETTGWFLTKVDQNQTSERKIEFRMTIPDAEINKSFANKISKQFIETNASA
jgi:hypothetical protein